MEWWGRITKSLQRQDPLILSELQIANTRGKTTMSWSPFLFHQYQCKVNFYVDALLTGLSWALSMTRLCGSVMMQSSYKNRWWCRHLQVAEVRRTRKEVMLICSEVTTLVEMHLFYKQQRTDKRCPHALPLHPASKALWHTWVSGARLTSPPPPIEVCSHCCITTSLQSPGSEKQTLNREILGKTYSLYVAWHQWSVVPIIRCEWGGVKTEPDLSQKRRFLFN